MGSHTTIQTVSQKITYGAVLAEGLVQFAQTHVTFASALATLLRTVTPIPESHLSPTSSPALIPPDELTANRRALWLFDACRERRIDGHQQALALLTSWERKRAYEEPKDLPFLLGVVVGVVPMVGMGHVPIKKEAMTIIVRSDIQNETYAFARTTTTLTHSIVEQGLILANGHTGKLEPELGDWLFGDKQVAFFSTSAEHLTEIERYLEELNIPHARDADAHGTTALACSPMVYVHDLPHTETLAPIETNET